jgi:NAD(P)H dehydrogenase (quinone)
MTVMVGNVDPMRVLVMHAHPLEDSYSAAIRDHAVAVLSTEGHEVTVVKLGGGEEPGPPAGELAEVDVLVLVHPTWWGGQPAPLLDWIQRELGPWIDRPESAPTPSPLSEVRHLAAVTTHGSSRWVNRLQGEPGRGLLDRCVLPLCAPGATFHWIALYEIDNCDRRDLEEFIDRVGRDLAELTSARVSA